MCGLFIYSAKLFQSGLGSESKIKFYPCRQALSSSHEQVIFPIAVSASKL